MHQPGDPVEKADQIKIMRFIYERAKIVEVWLGDRLDDHSDVALMAIVVAGAGKNDARQLINEPDMAWFLKDFSILIDQSYWKRVWIVQELVCAREILLYCGSVGISWHPIETINTWLIQWQNEYSFANIRKSTKLPLIGSPYIRKISEYRKYRKDFKRGQNLRCGTLMDLLGERKPTFASEPKDHIYGLLGIVEDLYEARSIPINYTLTTEQVFINATKHILVTDKNLCIFSRIQSERPEEPSLQLQSWCPDYSRPPDKINSFWQLCMSTDNCAFASAPEYRTTPTFLHNDRVLHLSGVRVDTVAKLAGVWDWTHIHWYQTLAIVNGLRTIQIEAGRYTEDQHATIARWFSLCMKGAPDAQHMITIRREQTKPPQALSDLLQCNLLRDFVEKVPSFRTDPAITTPLFNFLQTILADYNHTLSESIPNISSQYDVILGWTNPPSLHDEQARLTYTHALRNRAGTATAGRRFCISSNGHFGLVPPGTREDDLLCVLFGGPSVYVLRKFGGQERYTLVGEAYLHGYMAGEAITEMSEGNLKEMEFEIW